MAAVSNRYAEALLSSVKDEEKDKMIDYLKNISTLYVSNLEFKETFNNPRIASDVKLQIIKEIFPKNETFLNFINLVLKEGRFNLIEDIYHKYREMVDELYKRISIKIVSSCELSESEINGIVNKYKKLYDATEVDYEISVDETLIGGVKVIAGGKVYDGTIRAKLNEML